MCMFAYVRFLVEQLRQGERQFGIGVHKPMCVLIDRGGTVVKNGVLKREMLDMSVVPRLVELFRHLYRTVLVSLRISTVRCLSH